MAGVTDRPFRILCRQPRRRTCGLGDDQRRHAAVEHVQVTDSVATTPASPSRASCSSRAPTREALAQAARANVALGAQIIDLNMGCPAKKVCGRLCGSALLTDEPLVARILDAVVRAVDVPVTLKIRTGWDREHRNGVNIACIAEASGIAALAVHGRTRADFYEGAAEYDTIRAIKSHVRIPVFANGDIDGAAKSARGT